jgi:hypothetical protein
MTSGPHDPSRDPASRDPIEELDPGFSIAEIGTPNHPVSLPPISLDAPEPRPRARVRALPLLVTGAFLVWTGLLVERAREHSPVAISTALSGVVRQASASTAVPVLHDTGETAGLSCSEATAMVPIQLIELDAIQMTPMAPALVAPALAPAPAKPSHVVTRGAKAKLYRVSSDLGEVPQKAFFDTAAATAAILMMGADLSDCGAARGPVDVAVTFGPSGGVSTAVVEDARLQGTLAGSCIAQHLQNTRAPEFDGEHETVRMTLMLK